jgi:hypothetical protein
MTFVVSVSSLSDIFTNFLAKDDGKKFEEKFSELFKKFSRACLQIFYSTELSVLIF